MTLDEMLVKYTKHYAQLVEHNKTIEAGIIPFADANRAPVTIEEATQCITGMMFVAEQIINDLLEAKMELVFEQAEAEEDSSLEVN